MILIWLVVKIDVQPHRRFHLRVPLLLVWLLLLPLAFLLAPAIALFCLLRRINPIRVSWAALHALGSTSGTCVEVQSPRASFLVRIV